MRDPLIAHEEWQGKIEVISRAPITNREELSTAYTPGVAIPCLEIEKNPDLSYTYTRRANLVAVVSDGSAVLGLGNIGGLAGMPVMEGKCALFKTFADVDAFPICLSTQDTDEIVRTVAAIAPSFGGINLEDISAPRCFEVEKRLIEMLDIPVFHDDQHGTAVVTLAALINSLKLVGKRPEDIKIVMQGAGSAGVAVTKLLLSYGVPNVIMIDRKGIIYEGRADLNESKVEIAGITNRDALKGSAKDAFSGADVFIGVSQGNTVTEEMIRLMNKDAIVFAMANPTPEISPEAAKLAGARVIGTGRSDYPNQINNVLAFPGIFKGALSVRASRISEGMKVAAAYAIASCVDAAELCEDYIIPNPFDKKIAEKVSQAVASTAKREGLNRI